MYKVSNQYLQKQKTLAFCRCQQLQQNFNNYVEFCFACSIKIILIFLTIKNLTYYDFLQIILLPFQEVVHEDALHTHGQQENFDAQL